MDRRDLRAQIEGHRTSMSGTAILAYLNGLLWGVVAVQLLRRSSRLVCQPTYRETFGAVRPLALFYASPWFWLLVSAHGAFVVALTHSLWQVLLD